MIEIPLHNADGDLVAEAIVDEVDSDLARHRWYLDSSGYPRRDVRRPRRCIRLHRAITGLEHGDPREVDHLNGNKLDNRRENLTVTTHAGNCQNMHTKRSLPRGVYAAPWGRFYAQVKHRGEKHCLGHFDTPEAAAEAAEAKRRALGFHGH